MDRKVSVYLHGELAGQLQQRGQEYHFQYIDNYQGPPISINLPVSNKVYTNQGLHPVFSSLAPEGWLKKAYAHTQKIDEKDTLAFLLNNGLDLIGAIQLKPAE